MKSRHENVYIAGLFLCCAIGGAGFAIAAGGVAPLRAWESFLVNLLFWTGLAQAAIVMSAALYICQARWGGPALYRLAEAGVGFVFAGFVLFWALFAGRYWIFPWLVHPIPAKTPYLNVPFLFARDGAGLLVMCLLSWVFVKASRRRDVIEWADKYDSLDEAPTPVRQLATVVIISFVIIYSVLAIDLVMSLSPQWYSTMFGLYFCFGAFVSAISAMALAAAVTGRPLRHDTAGERGGVLHDLGKLAFAAPTFWAYLLFSMYLVIWFGDIPKTAFFVAIRVNYGPWNALGWTAFVLIWVIPFVILMGRAAKGAPVVLGTVCLLSLMGWWIERYVLVAPSLSPRHVPYGWVEIAVTIGFFGLFGLTVMPGLHLLTSTPANSTRRYAA